MNSLFVSSQALTLFGLGEEGGGGGRKVLGNT